MTKLARKIINQLSKKLPVPLYYPIKMSTKEKRLFDQTLKNSEAYLEFGSGGSTIRALIKAQGIVISTESSQEWMQVMRSYYSIRQKEKSGRLIFFHADIGKTGAHGKPINDKNREKYPDYSAGIFKTLHPEQISQIDTILVDGRFRVACVLKTIMECHSNKRLIILVHDFHREKYHVILKYLNVKERADSLCSFEIKKSIDLKLVQNDYEAYKFNPA